MLEEYLKEEYDRETLRTEVGFASYKIFPPHECFVGDMFVELDARHKGEGQKLGRALEAEAMIRGCKYLSCIVTLDEARPEFVTRKVKSFIDFGFVISKVVNNQVLMHKELPSAV